MDVKLRAGISACLLGEKVRYDGGHKFDPFILEALGGSVEFVPVCPEAELGLGVPREPMRLEGDPDSPRLVTVDTRRDLTDAMRGWALERVGRLADLGLGGFIFKARSPSCGLARVPVFLPDGSYIEAGAGLFARAFIRRFPELPVLDEESFRDPILRARFLRPLSA